MAEDKRVTNLTELAAEPAADDILYIVDASEAAEVDKDKYIQASNLLLGPTTDIVTNATAIALNTTHSGGDGSDHADVSSNTTAIALNTTHRGSDGTDHGYIDQDVQIAASPTFAGATFAGGTLINSSGQLTLLGAINANYTATIKGAYTAVDASKGGVFIQSVYTPSANTAHSNIGLNVIPGCAGANNMGSLLGASFNPVASATGTMTGITGAQYVVDINGPTTLTNAIGMDLLIKNQGATAITSGTNVNIGTTTNTGGGSYQVVYGIRILDQTAGNTNIGIRSLVSTGANKYNLYLDGTAVNWIVGKTGFNVQAPLAQVHIDQSSSTGAIPVLILDQGDVSEQCIKFSSDATDRDVHLFTVDVTGAPAMMWDESNDGLQWNKNLGLGIAPTAYLHLKAGTAAAGTAPIKLTSGTPLTSPEAGTLEYNGACLHFTQVVDRRCVSLAADSIIASTVSTSTSETVIYTGTISAAELTAGKVLKVAAYGSFTTHDANDQVTIRIKLGTITVATLQSTAGTAETQPWHLWGAMTIRTIGAGGTVSGHAHIMMKTTETHTNTESTAINTTAANNITITAQWSDTSNSISIDQGYIEVLI